ncbi:hypothetical protein [Qipengyuania huizhouensis]|jgi:hypothetical protein|uniref:hypothetical protein n=1 Tax=Qipengyuania huizhouensis TaxID=2867245 RepID=UPI001C88D7FC|nr:hypothetical protein [Qipengyuania huizhouensis]MBX7460874.1 hypothetical protein [Qipengyuania huizhouensis]
MRFRTRFNAAGGIADFWNEWKKPTPYRWPILAASFAMTGTLFFWLTKEEYYYPPEVPQVTYITTFAEGRTDEEIRQSNIENQRRKDELEAERARIEQRRRDLYKSLGAATGLDVEAMEAEAEAERAAEERAERERLAELFGESDDQTDGTVETAGE